MMSLKTKHFLYVMKLIANSRFSIDVISVFVRSIRLMLEEKTNKIDHSYSNDQVHKLCVSLSVIFKAKDVDEQTFQSLKKTFYQEKHESKTVTTFTFI